FVISWPWVTAFALGGAICWAVRRETGRYALLLCLGAIATFALSYYVQHKGFGYHLSGVLPFLVVFMAVLVDSLMRGSGQPAAVRQWIGPWALFPRSLWWFGLACVLLIAAAGTASKLRHQLVPSSHEPLGVALQVSPSDAGNCESRETSHQAAELVRRIVPAR